MHDDDETEHLKNLLAQSCEPYNPDQSLQRVLAQAHRQSATKDVIGFFMSWIWVLFAGFGASMHTAYARRQRKVSSTLAATDKKATASNSNIPHA